MIFNTDLQANCQIDPTAERSADGTWMQTDVFKELTEGLSQGNTRPLFRHNHTRTHTGQIHPTSLSDTHTKRYKMTSF